MNRARRGTIFVWIVIAVLFAFDQARIQRAVHSDKRFTDLQRWLPIAADFVAHPEAPLYENHPDYVYPPWFLLVIYPLNGLSLSAAAFVVQLFKWIALLLCVRWCFVLAASPDGRPVAWGAAIASLLFSARFIINELGDLNVNAFILFGVLASVVFARRGRPGLAGAALALATATKVTPALVIVYWAYQGRWRVVLSAVLTLIVILMVVPAAFVGPANALGSLHAWYDHLVAGYLSTGQVYSVQFNQSITGLLNRLFADAVVFDKATDVRMTVTLLSPGAMRAVRLALFAVVLVALAIAVRPSKLQTAEATTQRDGLADLCEIALVLIAMLLLSGYSWKAHYVSLLPGYVAACAYWARLRRSAARPRRQRIVGVLLLLSFVLCTGPCDIIGTLRADWAEAYGVIMFGAIALAAALIVVRSSLRASAVR